MKPNSFITVILMISLLFGGEVYAFANSPCHHESAKTEQAYQQSVVTVLPCRKLGSADTKTLIKLSNHHVHQCHGALCDCPNCNCVHLCMAIPNVDCTPIKHSPPAAEFSITVYPLQQAHALKVYRPPITLS